MGSFKKFFKYMSKYKLRYTIGILALMIVDIIQLIPPKIIGFLTDLLEKGEANEGIIIKYIAIIIFISLFMAGGRYFWRIFIIGTSRRVEYEMRNNLFLHLQKLSQNFYNKNKTGDLMALATNDLNAVRMAMGPGIVMITDSSILTITTLSIMFSINAKLTLMVLIPMPFLVITVLKFGKTIHSRFLKVQQAFAKLTDVVQENFSGIRIIQSFVQEAKEYEKFKEENENNFSANMNLIRVFGLFHPLIEFISMLSFIILIGIGGTFVIYNYISLGDFIAFNLYLGSLVWPMMAVGWVINMLQRGEASLERIEEVLYTSPEIYDKNIESIDSLNGDIEINDLTFKYPESNIPALKNINIKIKKGQTLGIIGRTGSGKSTLVSLLLRLYNIEDGKIFINAFDINRVPLKILREKVGFVPQDSFMFSTSVAENINLPIDDLSFEKIEDASKKADIYDNIIDFKDKFETIVGERGATLSGGQKQRISIARALIKNPEILVFDDCLSAVDSKTEVEILQNLKEVMADKTSIIISHRISAVKDSDIIIVLDGGEIVENGCHDELILNKGIYSDIYEKQLIEERIEEV